METSNVIDASAWLEKKLSAFFCVLPPRDADFRSLLHVYRTIKGKGREAHGSTKPRATREGPSILT